MTEKQKLFCDEYLIDLNGTRAYRTVYKTIKNDNVAGVRANKLLKQKDIAEYINKRLEEIHNEKTADIQEVMEYLTSVMRGKNESNVLALAGDGFQEVIAKPPDEKERLKAAELLGKRFGMFRDNVDITSNGQTVIVDDIDES
ncbi:terminase small subunit [Coprobacillus sp. AM29-13]|nr:terminase small subunit [Coprobacillus sp. AF19-3]RHT50787.1 terminase small subunit [Coprobacillus sp. AM29-13]